jgi:hypothetical protein
MAPPPDTGIAEALASVIGTFGGIAGVAWLISIARKGTQARKAEVAAREHFDRHGRWPED